MEFKRITDMEQVKVIIVEDELIIAESLKIMLENMSYTVSHIYTSGKAIIDNFVPGMADIIFMDIHLSDRISGIDASIEIRKISTIPIIYITDDKDDSIRKKAIYETNAVQYITKPFSKMDIAIAIDLAINAIKGHELQLERSNQSSKLINTCVFVKGSSGFRKIMISDILYLQADRSYCLLFYRSHSKQQQKESILFTENLSFMEAKLKFSESLVRIHRSYIVNINEVDKMQENRLWIGEEEIPIGNKYKFQLRELFRFI